MSYVEVQRMLGAPCRLNIYYWKSNFVPDLTPGLAISTAPRRRERHAFALPIIPIFEIKGQIQRVPKDAIAFDHRDANFEMSIIRHWTDSAGDGENMQWARQVWTAAQPYVSDAVYANHMTNDEPLERLHSGYGKAKYEKLAALKAKYDPDNFFQMNHNIQPEKA